MSGSVLDWVFGYGACNTPSQQTAERRTLARSVEKDDWIMVEDLSDEENSPEHVEVYDQVDESATTVVSSVAPLSPRNVNGIANVTAAAAGDGGGENARGTLRTQYPLGGGNVSEWVENEAKQREMVQAEYKGIDHGVRMSKRIASKQDKVPARRNAASAYKGNKRMRMLRHTPRRANGTKAF